MNKIPKIVYFYWGGPVLPYLRYMALYTFKKFNPDWKVTLFTPIKLSHNITWGTHENEEPIDTKDYMDRLKEIDINVHQFNMETIGYSNDLPEVVKSDLLRLYLLSTTGGLWSDNDIVFFRPIEHTLRPTEHTAYFCFRRGGPTQDDTPKNGPMYHSIGFLLSEPQSEYFKMLFEGARAVINTGEYQSVGSPYYKQMIDINAPGIYNLDINFVYPSRAAHNLFTDPSGHHIYQILSHTIGFHWYAGAPNSGKYQNMVTEETYRDFDNVICWILRKVHDNEPI